MVVTTRCKPILTTWGFGLGRVISFTTDNGGGDTRWASAVYSGANSQLISSMINWAIGDPRPKEGVKLDGAPLDLSRTGQTIYETTTGRTGR